MPTRVYRPTSRVTRFLSEPKIFLTNAEKLEPLFSAKHNFSVRFMDVDVNKQNKCNTVKPRFTNLIRS
jgi:hypothetical protein